MLPTIETRLATKPIFSNPYSSTPPLKLHISGLGNKEVCKINICNAVCVAPITTRKEKSQGSVVYDPLQTHVFVCNIYKGVMEEPLIRSKSIQIFLHLKSQFLHCIAHNT